MMMMMMMMVNTTNRRSRFLTRVYSCVLRCLTYRFSLLHGSIYVASVSWNKARKTGLAFIIQGFQFVMDN